MRHNLVRCHFARGILMDEVETTLALALLSTQALHGEARTRLEVKHRLNRKRRWCEMDVATAPGATFAQLVVGLLTREFGAAGFRVEHGPRTHSPAAVPKEPPVGS